MLSEKLIIGGVDEAGRGPVLGPMVIAGVSLRKNLEFKLAGILKDSKKLTPGRREKLFRIVKKIASNITVKVINPEIIDKWITRFKGGLNLLEVKFFAEVISDLRVKVVYVDSCDIKPERFRERIKQLLEGEKIDIISETGADEKYPVVSAASIVAKVLRDREIERLKRIYGDFGSGYSSDERTVRFLEKYYLRNKRFPPIARQSYKTIFRIKEKYSGLNPTGG